MALLDRKTNLWAQAQHKSRPPHCECSGLRQTQGRKEARSLSRAIPKATDRTPRSRVRNRAYGPDTAVGKQSSELEASH